MVLTSPDQAPSPSNGFPEPAQPSATSSSDIKMTNTNDRQPQCPASSASSDCHSSESRRAHNAGKPGSIVRKDTGIQDHMDKAQRQSDQLAVTKDMVKCFAAGFSLVEEEEEDEEETDAVKQSGAASLGCLAESSSPAAENDPNPLNTHIAEEEDEEDEFDALASSTGSSNGRSERKGPYMFKRKDTGIKDHASKQRRRSDDAAQVRQQIKAACTSFLEEEEEEEEGT